MAFSTVQTTPAAAIALSKAALAGASVSAAILEVVGAVSATKGLFKKSLHPAMHAALDRLAAEGACIAAQAAAAEEEARECVETLVKAAVANVVAQAEAEIQVKTLVKTAIANVVAQAEARECVAKMVQAAVDSVLAGSASKGPHPEATEVLDIEEASLSDENVGIEVEVALCDTLVEECCDEFDEDDDVVVEANHTASKAEMSRDEDAGAPDMDAAELCSSKNRFETLFQDCCEDCEPACLNNKVDDVAASLSNDAVPPRRRTLAGQVPEFPLEDTPDEVCGGTTSSQMTDTEARDDMLKTRSKGKKGGAGKKAKRSKAARQGKKGKHAKKGKKGRA